MRNALRLAAVGAMLSLASAVMGAQVDNPEYAQWSKYKAGTSTTVKQTTEMPGMADNPNMPAGMNMAAMMPQTTVTTKVTEVKPEAITLEVTSTMTMMGTSRDNKSTRVVPAKIESSTTKPAPVEGITGEIKNMKEGKDTVEVKGKKIDTVTQEFDAVMKDASAGGGPGRGSATPQPAHMKVWTSPEVPGGMVKEEVNMKVEGSGDMKMTMTLTDYNVVK